MNNAVTIQRPKKVAVENREKLTFGITGMSCASCAAHIEHNLMQTPGVIAAEVNFATQSANVEFDKSKTGE
ncbi:MAG TPA: cation transporter, partial [Pyrinomonadaceae bacterium]|nr:cation transporter [Pyrinomonadaceae bacterium]